MKTNILGVASFAIIASSLFISSCKKDDVTAPVVTLNGDAAVTISLQGTYNELGATAKDDRDDNVTVEVSGTVDKNAAADYTITYTSTDKAGNIGTATRTVHVVNDAAYLEGSYSGEETDANGPYTYTQKVAVVASTTVNNRVTMTRFADFTNNTITMNITGTNIDVPSQTIANVGTGSTDCDVHSRTTSGTGTISGGTLTITYNDSKVSPCTGSRTGVVATFTK